MSYHWDAKDGTWVSEGNSVVSQRDVDRDTWSDEKIEFECRADIENLERNTMQYRAENADLAERVEALIHKALGGDASLSQRWGQSSYAEQRHKSGFLELDDSQGTALAKLLNEEIERDDTLTAREADNMLRKGFAICNMNFTTVDVDPEKELEWDDPGYERSKRLSYLTQGPGGQ